jgi:hypothetical protein
MTTSTVKEAARASCLQADEDQVTSVRRSHSRKFGFDARDESARSARDGATVFRAVFASLPRRRRRCQRTARGRKSAVTEPPSFAERRNETFDAVSRSFTAARG